MVTVEGDAVRVERRLAAGRMTCPGCAGALGPWGRARPRRLRGREGQVLVHPRRARCRSCLATHVLLPVACLSRRADLAVVIGAALAAKAAGAGHRRIALTLGRPEATVRGWLRRFASRLGPVETFFTAITVRVGVDPVLPAASGSGWVDALAAVVGAAVTIAARFAAPRAPGAGAAMSAARVWASASAVTGGGLLSPSWPPPRPSR